MRTRRSRGFVLYAFPSRRRPAPDPVAAQLAELRWRLPKDAASIEQMIAEVLAVARRQDAGGAQ